MTTPARYLARFETFFLTPSGPQPLGLFRILMSLFALVQLAIWAPDWAAFFGPDAWMQWEISTAIIGSWQLHLSTIYGWLQPLGVTERGLVWGFFAFSALAYTGLLLGWKTRLMAVLAWAAHYVLMSTISSYTYGVDIFLHIALFYLVIMPAGQAFSLDARRRRPAASWSNTLSMRVLQIHLCLAYLSAGYEKMLAPDWWSGNVLWRALVQPDFRQVDLIWLGDYPWVFIAGSVFTMTVETFYCIAMWVPKLRVAWLLAMIALHLGIGLFLGLWMFGIVMILLSVSAFGFPVWSDIARMRPAPAPAPRPVLAEQLAS